jgi:cell shape-determining protein MreD
LNSGPKRAFVCLFALFLAQNAAQYVFPESTPPLVLIGLLFFALSGGPLYGLALGLFAGIFFEIFGIGKMGLQMAVFGVLGASAGALSSKIFRESLFGEILLPAAANYFAAVANCLILKTLLEADPDLWSALGEAFSWRQLILTLLFSPLIFSALRRVSSGRGGAAASRLGVWR